MNRVHFYFLALMVTSSLLMGCSDDETAASSSNGGSTSNTGSLGPSIPTGIPTHRDFQILYDPVPVEIFDSNIAYTKKAITISIHADDINDLPVSGRTVNFATEWGTFTGSDSCILEDGRCQVTWEPGHVAFAPADCLVSFTAWTIGEEKFSDQNNNGLFDTGEGFTDLEEPYLDINSTGAAGYVASYDSPGCNADLVCEAIDIVNFTGTTPGTANGIHDPADGFYNGTLCAASNPACSTSSTSTMIHTRSTLRIQEPFDHDSNPATPDNVICN